MADQQNFTLRLELTTLLRTLRIPIHIESPTDLTPSLLLTILETLIGTRIPLPVSLRSHLSPTSQNHCQLTNARIEITKIFLGVLEHDVLKRDVGLSNIDPRKLANGAWEETVFVARLLCWIGRRLGYLPPHVGASTISPSQLDDPSLRSTHQYPTPHLFHPSRPASDQVPTTLRKSQMPRPRVRYMGHIEPFDEQSEIESFEASQSVIHPSFGLHHNSIENGGKTLDDEDYENATRESGYEVDHEEGDLSSGVYEQTLALLQERARLLEALSSLEEG